MKPSLEMLLSSKPVAGYLVRAPKIKAGTASSCKSFAALLRYRLQCAKAGWTKVRFCRWGGYDEATDGAAQAFLDAIENGVLDRLLFASDWDQLMSNEAPYFQ